MRRPAPGGVPCAPSTEQAHAAQAREEALAESGLPDSSPSQRRTTSETPIPSPRGSRPAVWPTAEDPGPVLAGAHDVVVTPGVLGKRANQAEAAMELGLRAGQKILQALWLRVQWTGALQGLDVVVDNGQLAGHVRIYEIAARAGLSSATECAEETKQERIACETEPDHLNMHSARTAAGPSTGPVGLRGSTTARAEGFGGSDWMFRASSAPGGAANRSSLPAPHSTRFVNTMNRRLLS